MSAPPRIAMFLCVQNEERFLETHLRYHFAAGVGHVYLFLDQSTDRSRQIAESFSSIDIVEIPPEEKAKHSYICDLHCACMGIAIEWAMQDGWDWLLTIDPDEFAVARPDLLTSGNSDEVIDLRKLAGSVKPETFQIRFPTWEVVPESGLPWWQQKRFQSRNQVSYQLPGEKDRWKGFLGHAQGKSMIRTNARVQAYDSHRWVIDQSHWGNQRPEYAEIPTEWHGCHLHFYLTDPAHLLEKFRKAVFEPEVWFCGTPVEAAKQRYKEIAAEWNLDRSRKYLENELRPRIEEGDLTEVSLVCDFHRNDSPGEKTNRGKAPAEIRSFPRDVTKAKSASVKQGTFDKSGRIGMHDILPDQLKGFFGLELHDGEVFRWSGPSFSLQIPGRDAKEYSEFHLDMRGLSEIGRSRTLHVNLGSDHITGTFEDDGWRLRLPFRSGDWLTFSVKGASVFPGDTREMGVPLFGITIS